MDRFDRTGRYERVVQELNEERAAALRRVSDRLERLIAQLNTARAELVQLTGADRAKALAAYNELRRHARRYRWYLEVQREAIGLRQHHRLDEFYQIPGPITD